MDIEKGDLFPIDKPAGVACPNLNDRHLCRIHSNLENKGFGGCIQFDCLGAGQRVVQDLFNGVSWRDDPKILSPMSQAFRDLRDIHEALQLLFSARALPLSKDQAQKLERFINA